MTELEELLREQRLIVSSIKATVKRMKKGAKVAIQKGSAVHQVLLLDMAEGLIAAHKAARFDDDGYTLDLIEEAMRHVGERLAKETVEGRKFIRKRPGPA